MSERAQVIAYMDRRIREIERVQERLGRVKTMCTKKAHELREKLYELDALKCSYKDAVTLMKRTGQ